MSGISRRVDQLGRVVIPIEIRKSLKLQEGSLLEIEVKDDCLLLKKNEPLKNFKMYIEDVCNVLDDCIFFVISENTVIFANEKYKKYEGVVLSENFISLHKNNNYERRDIVLNDENIIQKKYAYLLPLNNFGDNYGYALFLYSSAITQSQIGVSNFIVKYIISKL